MSNPPDSTTADPQATAEFDDDLPPGQHAVEIAARAGFGPLSPRAKKVWHGDAVPCVSCGQLCRREEILCEHCGQDLSEEMIEKMRTHSGPWFVLEHVRPFPGVSLERIVRQIRRGLVSETSIIRGPASDYQWRFAVETPGLCRYFGRCWHCHQQVSLSDTYCQHCLSNLSFERSTPMQRVRDAAAAARLSASAAVSGSTERHGTTATGVTGGPGGHSTPPSAGQPGTTPSPVATSGSIAPATVADNSQELARLSAAIRQAKVLHQAAEWDEPPRIAGVRATWIAAALILAAVVILLLVSRARSERTLPSTAETTRLESLAHPAPIIVPQSNSHTASPTASTP